MDFNNARIEEHMRFICPECGIELPTQNNWRKHLNITHEYNKKTVDVFNFKEINDRYHECNECHKWVANGNQSITTLQYHRISHLPYNLTFKCRYCVRAFARKRALCEHLLSEHANLLDHHAGDAENHRADETMLQHNNNNRSGSPGRIDQMIISDLEKNKRDPGDLIQKALLDSLIDLENETLGEYTTKSNSNVNDFALNQSLNDLEAILKSDLEQQNVEQQQQQQYLQQSHEQISQNYNIAEPVEYDDNELLEQICADIFEEVEEPAQTVHNSMMKTPSTYSTKTVATEKEFTEESDEKIISIEIKAVNETERNEMFSSPKRKRLKLDDDSCRTLQPEAKMKLMLETYIIFLCPECGREFKTQSLWRDHVFKVHDLTNTMYAKFKPINRRTAHVCLDCRQVLYTSKIHELQRHRFTHMPFQSYLKCTFCSKTKSSKPKMIQHLQKYHANSLVTKSEKKPPVHLKCLNCCKSFQTRTQWQTHREHCPRNRPNIRSTNDSTITNNMNLITHLKKMRARMRTLISAENADNHSP